MASSKIRPGTGDFDARSFMKNICEPDVICNKKGAARLTDRLSIDLVEVTFVADTVSLKLR